MAEFAVTFWINKSFAQTSSKSVKSAVLIFLIKFKSDDCEVMSIWKIGRASFFCKSDFWLLPRGDFLGGIYLLLSECSVGFSRFLASEILMKIPVKRLSWERILWKRATTT